VIEQIDERLKAWGRHVRRDNNTGLGFPSVSIEYKLMKEGCSGAAAKTVPMPEDCCWPADIKQVDEAVMTLPDKQRQAVTHYYVKRDNLKTIIKSMDVKNKQELYKLLNEAKWWLKAKVNND